MAGRRRQPRADDDARRPSAISELTDSHDLPPARVELLESRPSLLATHRRAFASAGLALLLVAALVLYLTRPQPAPVLPTAWPALHATVTYDGTLPAVDPAGRTDDFVISVRNRDGVAMTVVQISFAYQGLTLRTEPRLPLSVQAGQTVRIQLITTARDCSHIPVDDELPYIDVTFRNIRAIGQESEILGDRYTSDLHHSMSIACRRG